MPVVTLLNEAELRASVALDLDTVRCIEDCFRSLATEAIVMPPILRLDIHDHNGEVDVKTAYVPALESFAIKISPGFFDNPKLGLPSVSGLMVLLSAKTGVLQAMLLDNGYLTDVRTAAAGAVGAKWLAREDAHHAGIIGAGTQARLQLRALRLVRDIDTVSVWARSSEKAHAYGERIREELGLAVSVHDNPEALVRESDIVVTTTPSREALIQADWLHPGLHITAVGSDAEHKNELAPEVVSAADLYVCDRLPQCAALGELHHAIAAALVPADARFPELGQVIAGQHPGRTNAEQISVCDLTGTGTQDTAIATLAYQRAKRGGRGTLYES